MLEYFSNSGLTVDRRLHQLNKGQKRRCLQLFLQHKKARQSPDFSLNVINALNFQVNFINLQHYLQGLKLPSLHLSFEQDVNFDLDVIQNLHHILHSVKMNFCEEEY